ncbi:MAG: peptidase M28 family protein, partial [Chitinophagales bacterium]
MKKFLAFCIILCIITTTQAQQKDSAIVKQIYTEVLTNGECYGWLEELCKEVGHRLSGSPQADMAVRWAKETLEAQGFDKVWLQEVMVPRWVRGQKEYAEIIGVGQVDVLALGGSIATPDGGLQANIIEVSSFDELQAFGPEKIKGKIVFFNH